ncbi:MAG: TerC family protein [Acidobacteria bacterium]|nr:TerC family protein [Acidobacteriota bacterium]
MEFFSTRFLLDILSIVFIDLLLAGDNAVVIAMAVKTLPARERQIGITAGAALAVALRIILTFFAAQLLLIQFVKLIGGILILWIAVKLLAEDTTEVRAGRHASTLWQAMIYIVIADATMSTDNILAIAGTSKGHLGLLIFGLGLSIPFVVFTSSVLSRIMDRYPIIMYIGSAILGRVGGEMIITDPYIKETLDPPRWIEYGLQGVLTIAVVVAGWMIAKRASRPEAVTPGTLPQAEGD